MDTGAVKVDDLDRPNNRREEVVDSETEVGGEAGGAPESIGRIGVDSVCPTGFTIEVAGPEAGVV